MNWVNLHSKSTGSFQTCTMTTDKLVEVSKKHGMASACIMDYGSISLAYEFMEECNKAKIKPIIGIEAFVCENDSHITDSSNKSLTRISFVIKNKEGWKSMCEAVSLSNKNYCGKPRLSIEEWAAYANGNWIVISGFSGTKLYDSEDKESHLEFLKEIFGQDNVYYGVQAISQTPKETENQRKVAKDTNTRPVAIVDSHYADEEDAEDQRVLLCGLLKTTLSKVRSRLDSDDATILDIKRFFTKDVYYIPSLEELKKLHTEEEIKATLEIDSKCESYSLKNNPMLPEYTKGADAYENLVQRCRDGWKKLLNFEKGDPKKIVYSERIKHELDVIKKANLANYFLIVADICDYARNNGILMGIARGSAGGCLISYLTGITRLDPIPYNLLFSRFFNEARKNSLPDIDLDFQPSKRQEIIDYIVSKYGQDCVAKISTFSRLQGRGAIKEVLRAHEAGNDTIYNQITKWIPDESKIADELQQMGENDHENAKILYWAVINNAKELSSWVKLEKDGTYSGEYGRYFAQAIRLEGLYRQVGQHASGIVVTPTPLDNHCPLIRSKTGLDAGMPFPDLEGIGINKIDILGVNVLDKLQMIIRQMKTGQIYDEDIIEESSSDCNDETVENDV